MDLGILLTKGWFNTPQSARTGVLPPDAASCQNQNTFLGEGSYLSAEDTVIKFKIILNVICLTHIQFL